MNEPIPFSANFYLEELSNTTDEVFFAFKPGENILLFLNAAFEKVWEMPRESLGSDLSELYQTVYADDRLYAATAFAAILHDKQEQNIQFRILPPNGRLKWISVHAWVLKNDKAAIIAGTAADITNDKEYNNTLLKFANKKNAILEILSHDLASLLSNINMSAQLLADRTDAHNDQTTAQLLTLIKECSSRSLNMIRDLVNKEFLETSESKVIKQRTDIVIRIAEVIEQYKRSHLSVKQNISLSSPEKNLFVAIDESKFMQVINNLLSNALKFTPDNGYIRVTIEDKETDVLIKIEDTGIGIPADMQPYLFDRFTKARRPGIKGEKSTGLGMSIVKTIIEWHNGRIWFTSAAEKGTTFYIQIPKNN